MKKYCEENWKLVFRDESISIFENPNKPEIKAFKGNNMYSFIHEKFWSKKIQNEFIENLKNEYIKKRA